MVEVPAPEPAPEPPAVVVVETTLGPLALFAVVVHRGTLIDSVVEPPPKARRRVGRTQRQHLAEVLADPSAGTTVSSPIDLEPSLTNLYGVPAPSPDR